MGLFSKKKTYVESFSMPLVEDTPNVVQQSVLTSIRGERPIAEDLLANMLNGLGTKLTAYYNYGKDQYTYGLPNGRTNQYNAAANTVGIVIEFITGSPVSMSYSVYGAPDSNYFAEDHLENTRGWNRLTDEVTSPPFTPPAGQKVFFTGSDFINSTTIRINYTTDATVNPVTGSEDITIAAVDLDSNYYHASYFLTTVTGAPDGTRRWWFYNESDETYDILNVGTVEDSPYYPVVPLRYNNVDFTVDDGSERYRTSYQLLKRLGLDMTELGEGVNANPDVGDIDHAYVVMGVSTQTESAVSKKYLFNYFTRQMELSWIKENDFLSWLSTPAEEREVNTPPINRIEIKEAGISYNVEMGYSYITSTIITGSVAKVGEVETETIVSPSAVYEGYAYETSQFIMRKQITNTTYEELVVHGLKHINHISGRYTVDTTLADAVDSANDPDSFKDGLIIPINQGVFMLMSMIDRTELAYDAIRIMFNCITVVKLKWYQTGFFKFVAIAVSFALTIYSLGSLSTTLNAVMAFIGTESVIIGAVALGVITIGLKYGVAYLVDQLGIELGIILSVLASVVAISGSDFIDPVMLAQLQSGFSSGTQLAIDWGTKDIIDDYNALLAEIEEAQTELDAAFEELGLEGLVDPFLIADSNSGLARPNETPEDYYNTRLNQQMIFSIGALSVENYVANKLHLEGTWRHGGLVN